MSDFSTWLREQMVRRRLSSRVLAARAGLDHTSVCRVARGGPTTLATAARLADGLGAEYTIGHRSPWST